MMNSQLQGGLKYRTFKFRTNSKSENKIVRFWNGWDFGYLFVLVSSHPYKRFYNYYYYYFLHSQKIKDYLNQLFRRIVFFYMWTARSGPSLFDHLRSIFLHHFYTS